ncbi:MAG: hypothetical protein OHK0024_15070 [Thalassobaculales bacterium]
MTDMVVLEGVSHRFGDRLAVRDLCFRVGEGEIVAVVGKTGAGKSTAFNMIMGQLAPMAGSVRVAGLDPVRQFRALRGKLGVSFQTDRLLPWRNARENVEIGLQILGVPAAERARRADGWLARVGLADAGAKYPHELSGGMRQRVSLARALAVDPALLLFDESFSQLDPVTSRGLRADVSALVRDLGKTCLFITHRVEDAIEMADRILVLAAPAHVALELRPEGRPEDAEALARMIEAAMSPGAIPETGGRSAG